MFMLQAMDCKTTQPNMPTPPDEGRVCPAVYSPVCGANGQTYGNRDLSSTTLRNPRGSLS